MIIDLFTTNGLAICAFVFMLFMMISSASRYRDSNDKYDIDIIWTIFCIFMTTILEISIPFLYKYASNFQSEIIFKAYLVFISLSHFSMLLLINNSLGKTRKHVRKWYLGITTIFVIILALVLPVTVEPFDFSGKLKTVTVIIIIIVEVLTAITLFIYGRENKLIRPFPLMLFFIFYLTSMYFEKLKGAPVYKASFILTGIYYILVLTFSNRDVSTTSNIDAKIKETALITKAKEVFTDKFMNGIKSPMHNLIGLSTINKEDIDENIDDEIKVITKSGNILNDKINEVYEINNIIKNNITYNDDKYNFFELLDELKISLLPQLTSDRELIINTDSTMNPIFIGDREVLKKALYYLLSLSIENTIQGKITLDINGILEKDTYSLNMVVTNPGNKINKEIFDKKFLDFPKENEHIYNIKEELLISKFYFGRLEAIMNIDDSKKDITKYNISFKQKVSKKGE